MVAKLFLRKVKATDVLYGGGEESGDRKKGIV